MSNVVSCRMQSTHHNHVFVRNYPEFFSKNTYKKPEKERCKERTKKLTNRSSKIPANLDPDTKRAVTQANEKGASSRLTILPIEEYGFTLTKNEFRDAIHLHYNKMLKGMQSQCPCGQNYDVAHALNCKRGGFIIMRHNTVQDFEANLLKTTLNDVTVE